MLDFERERRALALFEQMLELDRNEREEWLYRHAEDDDELIRRVTVFSRAEQLNSIRTGNFGEAMETAEPPERIGAYRVGDVIGVGGMGSVYSAERTSGDFEHSVAIKLIKPGILSKTLVERFNRERQILARLNHPHIARLFDGGTTEDGQPYIVMERVNGEPLMDWIEAHGPDEHQRLFLFLQICDAVGEAHRNVIIHRDLTPVNVLVERDGQVKLIDFGIARPADEDDSADVAQANWRGMTLTPGFAAPERLRGEPATTSSDIYSAGRLLARAIDKPRPPELQVIINKATMPDANDRYLSMGEMAQDVRDYCAGMPVKAMDGGTPYRLGKWIARNRRLAALGVALAITLPVGLGATAWSAYRADMAREEADLRSAETRAIANTMMFDIYDTVSQVPGSERAREQLASISLSYLDRLAADENSPVDVQLDAARGYIRLGKVTGSTGSSNLGKLTEGRDLVQTGLTLLEHLHEKHPQNPDVTFALAETLSFESGEALYAEGDMARAKELANRALAIIDAATPATPEKAAVLADSYRRLGESHSWAGESEQAKQVFDQGIEAVLGLRADLRDAPEVQRNLGNLYGKAGEAMASIGQFDATMAYYELGYEIAKATATKSGDAPGDVRNVLIYLVAMSETERLRENWQEAERFSEILMKGIRAADAKSPDDASIRSLFVRAALQSALVYVQNGRASKALKLTNEAMRVSSDVVIKSGNAVGSRMEHAVRQHDAAKVRLAAGAIRQACDDMRQSVTTFQDYARTAPLPESNIKQNLEPMLVSLKKC